MKNQVRGIALILFGILLAVASIMANEFFAYYPQQLLWLLGLLIGVCGLVMIFVDKN